MSLPCDPDYEICPVVPEVPTTPETPDPTQQPIDTQAIVYLLNRPYEGVFNASVLATFGYGWLIWYNEIMTNYDP